MNDVSVVLCTYNGARYVEEQLRTILAQTRPPAEIVVGDDGSTDATLDLVEAVARSADVPIRVHRNPQRLGFADNFLAACGRATRPWIALADQDDRWAPGKLATARAAADAHGAVLCVHEVDLIDPDGAPLGTPAADGVPGHRIVEPLTSDPWANHYGFTMLFERSLLDRLPADRRGLDPYTRDAPLSHDRWIYFLASTFGRTVVLDDVLASYRQHPGQTYGRQTGPGLRERLATKLASGRDQADYRADLAAARVRLLAEFADRHADDAELRRAVDWWRALEANLRRRGGLYPPASAARRVRRLIGNVRAGTYRPHAAAGVGPHRLAEDVLLTAAQIVRRR